MSPRSRRLAKWIGYPLFALVALLVMIYLAFPYERIKVLIEDTASATGTMELSIGELGPAPLLGISASDVLLQIRAVPPRLSRSAAPPEKPKVHRYRISHLEVKGGLFAALSGAVDLSFKVEALGGTIKGRFESSRKKGWALDAVLSGLAARNISHLQLGPPLAGTITGKVQLSVPPKRIDRANGTIDLECAACSFGDGKAKLKVKGNAFMAAGITLPKIRLGRLKINASIKQGTVVLDDVSARSNDVELKVDGSLSLRKPTLYSVMKAYVTLKLGAEFKKSSPAASAIEMAFSAGKRGDGGLGILIEGVLRAPRVRASKIGLGSKRGRSGRLGRGGLRQVGRR